MDKKQAYLFCKFLETEMKKIDLDKWYEGEKINKDPGQSYIVEWIKLNAANWRKEWEESLCQHCNNWKTCGYLLTKECKIFEFDKHEDNIK
jgi:hypothetical protein